MKPLRRFRLDDSDDEDHSKLHINEPSRHPQKIVVYSLGFAQGGAIDKKYKNRM